MRTSTGCWTRVEVTSLDGSADAGAAVRSEETEYGLKGWRPCRTANSVSSSSPRSRASATANAATDERVEERRFAYDDDGNLMRETTRGFGTRNGGPVPTEAHRHRCRVRARRRRGASSRWRAPSSGTPPVRWSWNCGATTTARAPRAGWARAAGWCARSTWSMSRADFDAHYAGMDAAALGYLMQDDADGQPAVFAIDKRTSLHARGQRRDRDLGHRPQHRKALRRRPPACHRGDHQRQDQPPRQRPGQRQAGRVDRATAAPRCEWPTTPSAG